MIRAHVSELIFSTQLLSLPEMFEVSVVGFGVPSAPWSVSYGELPGDVLLTWQSLAECKASYAKSRRGVYQGILF